MSELKPCPFCGESLTEFGIEYNYAKCVTSKCKGSQLPVLNLDDQFDVDRWNNRPHENKIKAEAVREAAYKNRKAIVEGGDMWLCAVDDLVDHANKLEQGEK